MFIIKKILNSKKNCHSVDCIESDAFPVDANVRQVYKERVSIKTSNPNNNSYEVANVSIGPENGMNLNNAKQQLVVQFSNINGLQIGSTYNINKTSIEAFKNKPRLRYPKTLTIDIMMKSEDEPSREILNEVATHLGADYKNFMRELGFSDGQISAKNIDHNVYGVKEVIYQLLLDWMRNADGDATVGYLTTKLWKAGQRECVYRLKHLWKSKLKKTV